MQVDRHVTVMPSSTPPGRRAVLAAGAALGATALAGCLDDRGPEYRLQTRNLGTSLPDALLWRAGGPFPDADRDLVRRLAAAGSLTTTGFRLGRLGDEASYVAVDGTYHRTTVAPGDTVRRERWVLWFDLLPDGESPPDDATVVTADEATTGLDDLPEADRRAVRQAAGSVEAEFGPRDVADDPLGRRGHVFVRRTAEESDVLPDPPFDYLELETSDGPRHARAVAERGPVDLRQWRYTAERVAADRDGYERHVEREHLRVDFDETDLSREAREVVDAICGGVVLDERPPLPDGYRAVLEYLGLADVSLPEGETYVQEEALFRYDGHAFRGQVGLFG